jgi:hypothetical protein
MGFFGAALGIYLALEANIEKNIKDLDSNRFAIRQKASENLMALDELAIPKVKKALENKDISLEQKRRLEQIVENYYNNILPTDWSKLPWIDSLPAEYPERQNIITTYLNKARGGGWNDPGAPEYAAYREATRMWVRDELEAGKSKRELIKLMDDHMVPFELKWCKQAQPTYVCPIRVQNKFVPPPQPPKQIPAPAPGAELLHAPKEVQKVKPKE